MYVCVYVCLVVHENGVVLRSDRRTIPCKLVFFNIAYDFLLQGGSSASLSLIAFNK